MTSIKYLISVRTPQIWNEVLPKEEKEVHSHSVFLGKVKKVLESGKNENIFNKFANFESLPKLLLSTVSRQERGISGCYSIWDRDFCGISQWLPAVDCFNKGFRFRYCGRPEYLVWKRRIR